MRPLKYEQLFTRKNDHKFRTIVRHFYQTRKQQTAPTSPVTERTGLAGTVVSVYDTEAQVFYVGFSRVANSDFGRGSKRHGYRSAFRLVSKAYDYHQNLLKETCSDSLSYIDPDYSHWAVMSLNDISNILLKNENLSLLGASALTDAIEFITGSKYTAKKSSKKSIKSISHDPESAMRYSMYVWALADAVFDFYNRSAGTKYNIDQWELLYQPNPTAVTPTDDNVWNLLQDNK